MDISTLLGLSAGSLTTLAFVPQVLKTWRSKSGEDISLGMFLLFSTGVLLWLIYGILIDALPVILANAVTLLLSLTVLLLKLRYRHQPKVGAPTELP
jgi:MtN3 and saliva related transmembrane protein